MPDTHDDALLAQLLAQAPAPTPAPPIHTPTPQEPPPGTMTLLDHLRELRTRLVYACIGVLLGMAVGFFVVTSTPLLDYMILTFVGDQGVQIISVTESFTSVLGLALTLGFILAMPVLIYQLLAFLAPGLTPGERRWIFWGLPLVLFFFISGLVFGWFITAPAAIRFLVGFGTGVSGDLIENKPQLQDFIAILTRLLLLNGVIFEIPIVMFVLAKLKVLNPRKVAGYRRYVILAVVVIAAIVTPTGDPANLALIAIPMYLLFEFGLLAARLSEGKPQPQL